MPRLIRLSDASVIPVERYMTGPWDQSFGGGLAKTQTLLLGGKPGAGKSTLCLQICDELSEQTGRDTLFVGAEQAAGEIKYNAQRIGLRNIDRLILMQAMTVDSPEDLPAILSESIKACAPAAVIIDSLADLSGGDEGFALATAMCKSLKKDAIANTCPVILLQHVTKDGDLAGLMRHQHTVDGVGVLELDEKTEIRTLRLGKNRFGGTGKRTRFAMTEAQGLVHIPEETKP